MATTPFVGPSANTPGINLGPDAIGGAIKSAANASVDWVKASVSDYTFTGYGVVSRGSSVKMFMGTDQQFFLGGKNAMTIGTSNTFTSGIKTDVMVGPAVSMNIGFQDWKTAGTFQLGHLTAKYDFSTNKTFAFQIAPEGSSNYVTQSKFICEKGFQAVGGFQPLGQTVYSAYKVALSRMGTLVAVTNFLMSIQQIAQTLESPELKKGETLTGARALWAQILPGVVAGTSAGVITGAAIYAAIQRETNFKTLIHPQSVIDLTSSGVFLGALGNATKPTDQNGASLSLTGGKATLGARKISPIEATLQRPYWTKFNGFKTEPTAALEIQHHKVQSYGSKIVIAAGGGADPDPVAEAKALAATAAQTARDAVLNNPANNLLDPVARGLLADTAAETAMTPLLPAILAAQAAVTAAEIGPAKLNPSLDLSAKGGPLSKIEATAPNFNVISSSISLSDTPIPLRGLFVKKPSIQLVQSVATKISMDATGSIALTANPSVSLKLKPDSIVVQMGANTLTLSAVATTMKSGSTKIECSMGMVKVGSALKIMGA